MLDPANRLPGRYIPGLGRGTVYGSPVGDANVSLLFLEADENHPGQNGVAGHSGLDLAAPRGSSIVCWLPGLVLFAGVDYPQVAPDGVTPLPQGYLGNYAIVRHGDIVELFAHMDRVDVVTGQAVPGGSPIGIVGMAGFTTGPHLHWMVCPYATNPYCRSNGNLLDPIGRLALPVLQAADVAASVTAIPFFTASESPDVEGVRDVHITIPNPPQPRYPGTNAFVPLHSPGWTP